MSAGVISAGFCVYMCVFAASA